MSLFEPLIPALIPALIRATIVPRRSIGPFNATLTIEEVASDDLEITQHPVQQGAAITDHAYLKPATVAVKVVFNDEDAFAYRPLAETYAKLLQLQAGREPLDVVTGKRAYKNMLIKSLGQTNDLMTENVLSISMQLQEILLTSVEVVTVPERSKQADPGKTGATEKAGQKKAQPVTEPKKRSALRALAG